MRFSWIGTDGICVLWRAKWKLDEGSGLFKSTKSHFHFHVAIILDWANDTREVGQEGGNGLTGNTRSCKITLYLKCLFVESFALLGRGGVSHPPGWIAWRRNGVKNSVKVGNPPWEPRTAGRGTAVAGGRRQVPGTDLHHRCWSSARSGQKPSGRSPGSRGPEETPACLSLIENMCKVGIVILCQIYSVFILVDENNILVDKEELNNYNTNKKNIQICWGLISSFSFFISSVCPAVLNS